MGIIFFKGLTQKLICLRFQKKKKKFYFNSIYIIETTELGWLWTSMRSCHIYSYIFFFLVLSEVICYMHLKLGIENSVNKMSLPSS